MKIFIRAFISCGIIFYSSSSFAQTDIRITGAQVGFPIAVQKLCDAESSEAEASSIPERMMRNFQISGFFRVLNPATFLDNSGKCIKPEEVAYSDWSVISAEGLVRGQIEKAGSKYRVQLFLHNVQQQKPVLGKQYEVEESEIPKVADRFSNEVIKYFTGEYGIFGTKIAYVSKVGRFKELFVMDVDGTNIKQLTKERGLAISPSFSPTGDRIVYTSYVTRRPEIYTISPEGGRAQRITDREGLELGAEFTRDGQAIIAGATVSGISKIILFDMRGQVIKRLTSSGSIDVSPTYSMNGSTVAFCSNRAGGPQIYTMTPDGAGVKRISYTSSTYCTSPQYSPKGDKLAYICRVGGQNQVFVSSVDGSNPVQMTFAGNNEDPAWSPDGRYLAISSTIGKGGAKNIAILSLINAQMTQISFSNAEDSQPAWSSAVE
jgi:TolB protein